jgi:hypothetical protein
MVQPLYDSVLANLVHFYILTRLPLWRVVLFFRITVWYVSSHCI